MGEGEKKKQRALSFEPRVFIVTVTCCSWTHLYKDMSLGKKKKKKKAVPAH